MGERGKWLLPWQEYPAQFLEVLRKASEGRCEALFKSSKDAQSFRVRMQKMAVGLAIDPNTPGWLRKAADDVAWQMPTKQPKGWVVKGEARKPRYVPVDTLERALEEGKQ